MKKIISIAALALGMCTPLFAGDALTLDAYLGQVRTKGFAYRSAAYAVEGLSKQKGGTDLLYSPHLTAHAARVNDRQEQVMPDFYGNRTLADDIGVGLVKRWKIGPTTAINYGWTRTEINGSTFIPNAVSYQVRPSASVTLPLWRDFMGRQTRSQMEKIRFGLEAAQYGAAHQREGLLYQARNAYWGLMLAREEVSLREDTLKRAEKLVVWAERRVARRLADDSEGLQAKAMRRVRELEVQQAVEHERMARSAFNRLRGLDSEEVTEALGTLDEETSALTFQWPVDAPRRWDLRAAESQIRADRAAWKDAKANAWPDLNLFASVQSNGLDSAFNPAHLESTKGHHPTTKIGASIDVPLDIFTASKTAKGYEQNYQSARLTYADKMLETKRGWDELKDRLTDVEKRLVMAREIENIQKQKAEKERERLSLGRSTQFQVQSFEADYALSRLQRLAIVAEKLSLWAEAEWMMSADRETTKK